MKPGHKRLLLILTGLLVLGAVAALVLNAFQSNLVFYFSPTQVVAGEAPQGKAFRVGGLVKEHSLQREADGVTLRFVMTDTEKDIVVRYKGILPNLFREGKGAVVQGMIGEEGVFSATQVLAKHDENYMPPEAAQSISDAHARTSADKAAAEAAKTTNTP